MINIIKSAAKKMLIDFEDTKAISHNLTKGRAREFSVIENFLRPYLPQRFSISSGLIVDAKNQSSRQQDLVIYDNFYSPILMNMETDKIIFPETVFAAIEVKSNLTVKELEDMTKKSASIWGLHKTILPNIILSPSLITPSINIPILCIGMCFEASLTLSGIAEALRKIRKETELAYALSIVCVLQDKEQKAGLIVNNDFNDLQNILIIPNRDSRLGVIDCETSGDALLYIYLLLMEHLRNCGAIVPGPDLSAYARATGLGISERKISASEMAGAYVDISGTIVNTDIAKRISELTPRVLNNIAHEEDIFEWFYLLPYIPSGEVILNPRASFTENGQPLRMPKPKAVYDAIVRRRENQQLDDDKDILEQFVAFIHSIKLENRSFGMEEIL